MTKKQPEKLKTYKVGFTDGTSEKITANGSWHAWWLASHVWPGKEIKTLEMPGTHKSQDASVA